MDGANTVAASTKAAAAFDAQRMAAKQFNLPTAAYAAVSAASFYKRYAIADSTAIATAAIAATIANDAAASARLYAVGSSTTVAIAVIRFVRAAQRRRFARSRGGGASQRWRRRQFSTPVI